MFTSYVHITIPLKQRIEAGFERVYSQFPKERMIGYITPQRRSLKYFAAICKMTCERAFRWVPKYNKPEAEVSSLNYVEISFMLVT